MVCEGLARGSIADELVSSTGRSFDLACWLFACSDQGCAPLVVGESHQGSLWAVEPECGYSNTSKASMQLLTRLGVQCDTERQHLDGRDYESASTVRFGTVGRLERRTTSSA